MDLFAWDWGDQNPQGTGFWRCRCSRKSYNVVPAQALMELFLAEESGIHKRPDIRFQGIKESMNRMEFHFETWPSLYTYSKE